MKTKKLTKIAILASVSVLLGYVETLISLPFAVPGVKIGLSNIAVLISIYCVGGLGAFFVSFIKVLICAFLFSGFSGFLYSFLGAVLSFTVMYITKKSRFFSPCGVGALGGIFHNLGQIFTAMLLTESTGVIYYLPVLIFSGGMFGFFTGALTFLILKRLFGSELK